MRRLILLLLAAAACAQPGVPPGGPPDETPPKLISIRPDSNARNVRAGAVSFQFDEVVAEVPTGARSLANLFLVSPSHGPPSVSWHRTRVDVTPPGGLRPNVTYTVELLPGMTDLSRNVDSSGITYSFSTGPTLATGEITGIVFDWMAAKPAARSVVAAIALPDSLAWTTRTDSLGGFVLTHLPPGTYLLRGFVDQNNNRVMDPREIFDSVTVTLRDSLRHDMLAIQRDSIGPGILEATVRDSVTLHVTFDRAIDTAQVLTPDQFTLKSADSTAWAVRTVLTKAEIDRMRADSLRAKAVQDSVRRAFVADSIRQADSAKVAAAPPPTERRPGVSIVPPPGPVPDTTRPPIPRPTAKIPGREVDLKVERPLPPSTSFRLEAAGIRSVTGATRTSTRVFTTPRPKPPADSTRARPDTGGVRPPTDTGRVRRD